MSTQKDYSHDRRSFRVRVDFPVTVIVPGHELVLNGSALDVSRGGMRVATSTDLPMGQPIIMRFTLPSGERELLVHAKIVLSFYDASKKTYAHGIAFTQYTPRDQEEIGHFISAHEATK